MPDSVPPKDARDAFQGILDDLFGGNKKHPERGADRRVDLALTYIEARDGTQRDITFTRLVGCAACAGDQLPCPDCSGAGQRAHTQGFFTVTTACPRCKGRKTTATTACARCRDGQVERSETLAVTVPAGVADGQLLRLAGKGDERAGLPAGHLFVKLAVETENVLRRDGANAVIDVPVPLWTALFGGTLTVQTLDGPAAVRVHRRCFDGEIVTLRGHGYARAGGVDPYRGTDRGDQRVVLRLGHAVRKRRDQIRWLAIIAVVMGTLIALQAVTR